MKGGAYKTFIGLLSTITDMEDTVKKLLVMFLIVATLVILLMPATMQAEEAIDEYVVTVFYAEWDDAGWNDAHLRGWEYVKSQGDVLEEWDLGFLVEFPDGKRLRVHYVTNCGYDAGIESKMRSALEIQKPDMIYGTWWNAQDAIRDLAPEFPGVLFNHCSGFPVLASTQIATQNVSTYFVRMYYADYQVGKVTGWLGHSKIGLIGTYPIPEPVRGFNAFALGLQVGLREAGYDDDIEVSIIWIESWLDREAELLATQAQIEAGYPVIKQGADTPTTAQTACEAGVVTLGYGSDTLPTAPCTLVTNEWDWGDYYYKSVRAGMDGVWQPHDYYEPGTKLVFNDNVPQDVQDKARAIPLDEVWSRDVSGYGFDPDGHRYNILVPGGEITDDDLLSMQWWVDGIVTSMIVKYPKSRFAVD